jgi:hypothetical protein
VMNSSGASSASGGSIELVGATWKKDYGAQFLMGFGPMGPEKLGGLIWANLFQWRAL